MLCIIKDFLHSDIYFKWHRRTLHVIVIRREIAMNTQMNIIKLIFEEFYTLTIRIVKKMTILNMRWYILYNIYISLLKFLRYAFLNII